MTPVTGHERALMFSDEHTAAEYIDRAQHSRPKSCSAPALHEVGSLAILLALTIHGNATDRPTEPKSGDRQRHRSVETNHV
jgi:hypothetical protein